MVSAKLVNSVIDRDLGFCEIMLPGCMGEANVADHRASRGVGSSKLLDHPSALIGACGLCNGAKEDSEGAQRRELERRGVIVEKGRTHAHTLQKCMEKPLISVDGNTYELLPDGARKVLREGAKW